jgi:glycosyltransferase involved in cell wall biosynthesis
MRSPRSWLSVVVCTHNRPRDLERCLEALARLDGEPEVVVVDSAS